MTCRRLMFSLRLPRVATVLMACGVFAALPLGAAPRVPAPGLRVPLAPPPPGMDAQSLRRLREGADVARRAYQQQQDQLTLTDAMEQLNRLEADAPGRGLPGAAVDPQGRVYMLGGWGGYNSGKERPEAYQSFDSSRFVDRCEPALGVWRALSPMHFGRVGAAAVADAQGNIYALGGKSSFLFESEPVTAALAPLDDYIGQLGVTSLAERYDPLANRWSFVAPMHFPRFAAAAALDRQGRVYVLGGAVEEMVAWDGKMQNGRLAGVRESTSRAVDVAEVYTPSTDSWNDIPALSSPRAGATAVTDAQGRIYVLGGYDDRTRPPGPDSAVATVERYDPASGAWTRLSPMAHPRVRCVAAFGADGRLYAFGGGLGDPYMGCALDVATVEVYNPETDTWRKEHPLKTTRANGVALARPDGSFLLVGGGTDAKSPGIVNEHNTPAEVWAPTPPLAPKTVMNP